MPAFVRYINRGRTKPEGVCWKRCLGRTYRCRALTLLQKLRRGQALSSGRLTVRSNPSSPIPQSSNPHNPYISHDPRTRPLAGSKVAAAGCTPPHCVIAPCQESAAFCASQPSDLFLASPIRHRPRPTRCPSASPSQACFTLAPCSTYP
jgi:hypothetical protein